jgi:acyl carrier protein
VTADEVTARLARIWCDVLGVGHATSADDFFELAGGSLEAVELAGRVSGEFNREITIVDILDFPSFQQLANHIQDMLESSSADRVVDADFSLAQPWKRPSILQEAVLELDASGPPSDHFVLRFGYLIDGALDVDRMARAIELVAGRHELLRAAMVRRDAAVALELLNGPADVLRIIDAPCPAGMAPADHVRSVAVRHHDLTPTRAKPPLARFGVLTLAADLHALVVALDHIIFDGSSIRLLMSDIGTIYNSLRAAPDYRIEDVPVPFTRWAEEQRERLRGEWLTYLTDHWRDVLGEDQDIISPPLPWGEVRAEGAREHTLELSAEIRAHVAAASRQHRISPFGIGAAALHASIAQLVGAERACLTTSWVNRVRAADHQVLGPVAHDIYLRFPANPMPSRKEWFEVARNVMRDTLEHADIPNLMLYRRLWPTSSVDLSLLPVVYVTASERWASGFKLDGVSLQGIDIDAVESGRDLTCEFRVHRGEISGIDLSSASSGITTEFMAELGASLQENLTSR